jgi:hypothetical protein
LATLRQVPQQGSWVDQRVVRERSLDQLSPEACALSLFLVTVADAQGLSFDSERSRCQVFALDRATLRPAAEPSAGSGDDDPVDLKAVFKQIWEGLS